MKKLALLVAFAVIATAPTAAMAKTKKKTVKPAQQVQTDPQKMTYDEAMAYNAHNLSLIPKGLPLVLPSWTLPVYFAVTKEDEPAKPAKKSAKKRAKKI
ncbi:MAG: hypothetical protein ACTHLO_04000 [Pseudolabrys sp.]